jgi:DNA-binding NtrC family response regulator
VAFLLLSSIPCNEMCRATPNQRKECTTDVRILVVDDEITFLLGLKKFLQEPEMSVDVSETFDDAIALLQSRDYDFVITDIRLTGALSEEGMDILKYLKGYKSGIKVIVITGYGSREVMQKAYSLGADSYFEKPVSAGTLLNTMKKLEAER